MESVTKHTESFVQAIQEADLYDKPSLESIDKGRSEQNAN